MAVPLRPLPPAPDDATAASPSPAPGDGAAAASAAPGDGDAAAVAQEAIALVRDLETAAKSVVQLALAEAQLSYGAMRTAFLAGILRNVLAGAAVTVFAIAGMIALAHWLRSWPLALVIIGAAAGIGAFIAARIRHKAWERVGMPNTREMLERFTQGKSEHGPNQGR